MRCLSPVIFNLSDKRVRAIYSLLDNILLYNNIKHLQFPVSALVENNYYSVFVSIRLFLQYVLMLRGCFLCFSQMILLKFLRRNKNDPNNSLVVIQDRAIK